MWKWFEWGNSVIKWLTFCIHNLVVVTWKNILESSKKIVKRRVEKKESFVRKRMGVEEDSIQFIFRDLKLRSL